MHYDAYAFAEDKRYPTITSKKSDEQLGQRNGFSDVHINTLIKFINFQAIFLTLFLKNLIIVGRVEVEPVVQM